MALQSICWEFDIDFIFSKKKSHISSTKLRIFVLLKITYNKLLLTKKLNKKWQLFQENI
mgnify:CR=1 FL=1